MNADVLSIGPEGNLSRYLRAAARTVVVVRFFYIGAHVTQATAHQHTIRQTRSNAR